MNASEIKHRRIRVSVAACCYEMFSESIIDDHEYDELAILVYNEKELETDNKKLDAFFAKEYMADSGMWVNKHPELTRLRNLCLSLLRRKDHANL